MLEPRRKFLEGSLPIVLHHHERWNGTGYPYKLKKDAIPLSARIFAISDALDAMTSSRPYRKTLAFADAIKEVKKLRGIQFDPDISDLFLSIPQKNWEDTNKRIAAEIRSGQKFGRFSFSKFSSRFCNDSIL